MFGILARNYIAGQGRYRPENEKPAEKRRAKLQPELHLVKQPCPGCCHKDVCFNHHCIFHPNKEA